MADPILIWGAGAIGGSIGAWWARAGHDVLLVDTVEEHVQACRGMGLAIEGPVESFQVQVPALTPEEVKGEFRRVVLAVKAHHTEVALDAVAPHVAEDGFVLSAQNGLNELTIARRIGEARTMGAFVNFGADWHGPGQILFGNRGAVVVGELDGQIRSRTREMHELLRQFEPEAVLTEDIWSYLWGKLAYGAMLFATALNDDSMADNFADSQRSAVWLALGREVMAVARTRGVEPRGFNGFEPGPFLPGGSDALALESVASMAEFNRHSAKTHSGIWRDLAVRQRATEVDAQISIIDTLAREVGVDTPVVRALVELIHDVEAGRRKRSAETFEVLRAACH